MMAYVARHQGRLAELVAHVEEWGAAKGVARDERETGWELVQRVAREQCPCPNGACRWWAAARAFFERNSASLDQLHLAACTVAVLDKGPGKTRRIPLLVGPTNAGKSTVFDPVDELFGKAAVQHTPALGATMPLASLALKRKRFLYLDEFSPVEFASTPAKAPTIPKTMLLKLLAGQWLEVQVSQSFQNGNPDIRWKAGAVITAKYDGLWMPTGVVTAEDIRHMQSRVWQFTATEQISARLEDLPMCKESFCQWLVRDAAAFAARARPAAPIAAGVSLQAAAGPQALSVRGVAAFLGALELPATLAAALEGDARGLGAASVDELTMDDWAALPSWAQLLPLQQRRWRATVAARRGGGSL